MSIIYNKYVNRIYGYDIYELVQYYIHINNLNIYIK